jgi:hypothetical protein
MFESLSLEFVCRDLTSAKDGEPEDKPEAVVDNPAGDGAATIRQAAYTSFDDLDIGSSFFEQYLIQDARSGVNAAKILGGEKALVNFQQQLRQNGRLIASVVCRAADYAKNAAADVSPLWGSESGATTIQVSLKSSLDKENRLLEQLIAVPEVLEADLVWFDVQDRCSTEEQVPSALIVGDILELRRSVFPNPAEQPILIVSSLRGSARTVATPFVGGCDESLIHVPLWIDEGNGHARRLQRLAGSFDLLPTLAEYLTAEPAEELFGKPSGPEAPSVIEAESQDTFSLAVGPKSLRPLLTGRDFEGDRLLRLVGDCWTALRSQQYLLVSAEVHDHDSETISSGLEQRRLYLKPDDFWNVNDSIVTYEAVADEMDAVWCRTGG